MGLGAGPLAARCLGSRWMWTLAGTLHRSSLRATTALSLGRCTSARLGYGSVHSWRASNIDAVLLVGLRNSHHRREPLVLRDLHGGTTVRYAGLLWRLKVTIVRDVIVGLDIVHTTCSCIHSRLLRHSLLLVLIKPFGG